MLRCCVRSGRLLVVPPLISVKKRATLWSAALAGRRPPAPRTKQRRHGFVSPLMADGSRSVTRGLRRWGRIGVKVEAVSASVGCVLQRAPFILVGGERPEGDDYISSKVCVGRVYVGCRVENVRYSSLKSQICWLGPLSHLKQPWAGIRKWISLLFSPSAFHFRVSHHKEPQVGLLHASSRL